MDRAASPATRLTPMETLMWRLEGDRNLSSTFGSVTFLDRAPDRDTVRQRLVLALDAIPRFRQRIDTSGPPTTGAVWVDADLDLEHHLKWIELGGNGDSSGAATTDRPATEEAVLDLAAELVASPFDPDRPPWNFVVVTGLPDGRAALLQRVHHSVTDGEGGIGLAAHFVDLERDPDRPETPATTATPTTTEMPTWVDRLASVTADRAAGLVRTTTDAVRWTAGGVTDPGRFGRLGVDIYEATRSLRRQVMVLDRARSPLWKQRSGKRRLVVGSVPFAPVRATATEAGVSINDVFITAALRGIAAYHRLENSPVKELRVAVPVSTRQDRGKRPDTSTQGGNAFSPTRVTLPSGEDHTAAAHLRIVSDLLGPTKTERAATLIEPLAAVAEVMPTPVLRATMARQAATIDFAASNVRTTPVPLYIGGAQMEATYALGPLMGIAANITMLSYDGRLDLGIHVDPAAVTEPELLRDTVVAAFHEVCAVTAPR